MKCTNFGCDEDAIFFDRHHTEIALCGRHAVEYLENFAEWLWRGTPDTLREWLETFNRSGGRLT